jgi:hypothetical protein
MNSTAKFLMNLTVFAAIAGSVAMAQTYGARSLKNERANHPVFEVRVYDYAHLSRKTLQGAESEANRIFSNAGVNVRWIDCPTSHDVLEAFPACSAPAGATSNTLIIQTGATAAGTKAGDVLGQADDQGSRRSYVYYGRIENLAGGNTATSNILLGRVITHLMGRVLLGDNAYGKTGIMQDSWGYGQLNEIAGTQVLFTRDHARGMASRMTEQNQTLASSQTQVNANEQ